MGDPSTTEPPPEAELNEQLREVDWRFLLRQQGTPRVLDLTGRAPPGLRLVTSPASSGPEEADLVVLGFPTRRMLRQAQEALRPGGEVVCLWRAPRPAGTLIARRRLEAAGLIDVGFHWPGPQPRGKPEFWLPLHSPSAIDFVLAGRPPQSAAQVALRILWRIARRAGLLAPICAVGTAPGAKRVAADAGDPASERHPYVLLTGGANVFSKIVALPFPNGHQEPNIAIKFAREPESDRWLEQEAGALRILEEDYPGLPGVPRLLGYGRRAGRLAVAQSAIHGRPLASDLTLDSFKTFAPQVTRWLIELAGEPPPTPTPLPEWEARLITRRLDAFERHFSTLVDPTFIEQARQLLLELGDLPMILGHGDLTPWNVVTTSQDSFAVLDWESASLHWPPGLDLTYFLATSAFAMDGGIGGTITPTAESMRERYRHLLDPSTPQGQVAGECFDEYREPFGIGVERLARLRLLCWIIQAVSYSSQFEREEQGDDDLAPFTARLFVGLACDEVQRIRVNQ